MTDEDEWVDMIKRLRQNIADINQEFRKSVLKERITARRRPASEQDVAMQSMTTRTLASPSDWFLAR